MKELSNHVRLRPTEAHMEDEDDLPLGERDTVPAFRTAKDLRSGPPPEDESMGDPSLLADSGT